MIRIRQIAQAIISTLVILISLPSCGQKPNKTFSIEISNDTIWIPSIKDEAHNYKVPDTATAEIYLIFEQDFDDSIEVSINGKKVFASRIKTNEDLSRVEIEDEFKITYAGISKPVIEIYLIEKRKKILFHPRPGYQLCYINRIEENWFLEFSNYQRIYY